MAADRGDPLAQLDLGRGLLDWVRKSAAAENSDAAMLLADCYRTGSCGVAVSHPDTATFSLKAAQHGSARGAHDVGIYFLTGQGGAPQDATEAARWFHLAASQGCQPALRILQKERLLTPVWGGGE